MINIYIKPNALYSPSTPPSNRSRVTITIITEVSLFGYVIHFAFRIISINKKANGSKNSYRRKGFDSSDDRDGDEHNGFDLCVYIDDMLWYITDFMMKGYTGYTQLYFHGSCYHYPTATWSWLLFLCTLFSCTQFSRIKKHFQSINHICINENQIKSRAIREFNSSYTLPSSSMWKWSVEHWGASHHWKKHTFFKYI